MDPVERTIKSYDEIAEEYCNKTSKKGDREFQKKMLDRTLNMLPPKPRIIDIGCGDGRDTHYLFEKGADVVGIDLSRNMVRLARRKYPNCTILHMDMRETIFPENTFHGAWASASIINLPKSYLSKVESEVYRIIEPGGIFAFSFKIGEDEGFESNVIEEYPRYFSYYTIDELKDKFNLFDFIDGQKYPSKIFGDEFMYCWTKAKQSP
ncbi:MAG: class I SAM-dependent DNA methyltransferase [Thermoplasmatota archaeon]